MKQTHKMKCRVVDVGRAGHETWETAIERTVQMVLDQGWTLRAAIDVRVAGPQGPKPVLVFVRKERVG